MSIFRSGSPVIDGAPVAFNGGAAKVTRLVIPSGEFTLPKWLRFDGGLVVKVDALPFRGVYRFDELEILSSAPAGGFDPPDTLDWGYEGADETEASDGIVSNALTPLFPNTGWIWDNAVAYIGSRSAKYTYPASAGNVGEPQWFDVNPAQHNLYIAWRERKVPGWNSGDVRKLLRFNGPTLNGPWGSCVEGAGGTRYDIFVDAPVENQQTLLANENTPAPTPADLNDGNWHSFEVHRDARTLTAVVWEWWIDGIRYFNHTIDMSGATTPYQASRYLQFMSIINSMAQESSINVDPFKVSTKPIGLDR